MQLPIPDLSNLQALVPQALLVFVLVGCFDWAAGVALAAKRHVFDPRLMVDQLESVFLPYLTPMVAAYLAAPGDWRGAILAPAAAATAKLLVDLRDKIDLLLAPPPPIPRALRHPRVAAASATPPPAATPG